MKGTLRLRLWLFVAIATLAFALPSQAQGNIRTVYLVKVKSGQEENWKSIVKDVAALRKKTGSKESFTVWDSLTGPTQHAVVWYNAKWKEMDEMDPAGKGSEAEYTGLFARLTDATESLEVWIDELQPDMTMMSSDVPPVIRVGRTKVISGKMPEVRALFHDEVFPAVQKSGATSFGVAVARFGTPSNEIHTFLGLKGWGDLDEPVGAAKGMGADGYKAFEAKITPLIESTEFSIYKFAPELSYLAPAK